MSTTTLKSPVNIGKTDALIRAILALLLVGIVIGLDLSPLTSFILAGLSIPTMLFALLRWDPIYSLFGFATGKDKLRA